MYLSNNKTDNKYEKKKHSLLTLRYVDIKMENILIIVSSLKEFIPIMLKCLINLRVTSFLPPPGGPIAQINWTSCRRSFDVSFKSYLLNRKMLYMIKWKTKNITSSECINKSTVILKMTFKIQNKLNILYLTEAFNLNLNEGNQSQNAFFLNELGLTQFWLKYMEQMMAGHFIF